MTANDTDIDASEAARLEHRLTKVEQAIVSGQASMDKAIAASQASMDKGFEGVHERLDQVNGKVGKHESRLNAHDVKHATEDGARAEAMRLRLLDRSLIALSAVAGVAAVILGAVLR